MTIYVDLIFFINFAYDFLLLLTVSIILKRRRKLRYYTLAAIFGALSIFLLFININNILLFLLKVLVSIIMCLIAFGFVSSNYLVNNLIYLYMTSTILAGFLYFLSNELSYKHEGLIFFFKGLSVNYVLLLIIAPIILGVYIYTSKKMKSTYNQYYHIEIVFDDIHIKALSLLDTGNHLIDPITKKGVIIVNKKVLKDVYNIRSPVFVIYKTIREEGLMRCFKPSYILLNNKKIYNYLIGESLTKFADGVDCLLNVKLMEDNYV